MFKYHILNCCISVYLTFSYSYGYCQKIPKSIVVAIDAEIHGFADSTLFLLEQNDSVDSVYLVNHKFNIKIFKDSIPENIFLKSNSNEYLFFWIDNSTIHLFASKGRLKFAKITGSITQTENEILLASVDSIENKIDKLNNFDRNHGVKTDKNIDKLDTVLKYKQIDFIIHHPNSFVSLNYLNIYSHEWGKSTTQKLFVHLSQKLKTSRDGLTILKFISLNQNIIVGNKMIDFAQYDSFEHKITLSSFIGKIIFLDFWGSWCSPCRSQNKLLVNIYSKYHRDGFEIISVSNDTNRDQWINAISQDNMTWINLSEYKMQESTPDVIYGVYKFPTTYLINRQGVIIEKDLPIEKLDSAINKLINDN